MFAVDYNGERGLGAMNLLLKFQLASLMVLGKWLPALLTRLFLFVATMATARFILICNMMFRD